MSITRRLLHAVAGTAALAGSVALIGPWALALWITPDIAVLAGITRDMPRDGRLHPRAVPLYNALHALPGPFALIALGAVTGPVALGLGVLWLSHVLLDRAMGYGLRTREGLQRA